ncbi:MAG: glycoside hydrolase family 9 protein [Planctomycetota bacterium]|nr:glycoside hydrolase family 9 protein [Planctomycetota bacterium]
MSAFRALSLLLLLNPLAGCGEEPAAPERVTAIVDKLQGDSFGDGYVFASGCKLATKNGRIPVEDGALKFSVEGAGGHWGAGLARKGWVRFYLDDYGPTGVLEFQVRGAAGGERFRIGVGDSDVDGAGPDKDLGGSVPIAKYAQVTKDWQTVRIPIKDLKEAEQDLDLADGMKVILANDGEPAPGTFFLKGIRFVSHSPENTYLPVKVNQLGYRAAGPKVAKVTRALAAFKLVDVKSGASVFEGDAKQVAERDKASGDSVWDCDFSAFKTPGTYRLEAEGIPGSEPFAIRDDLFDKLFYDSARFYYLQRCGCELPEKFAGAWKREACHLGDTRAVTREGKDPRDVSGGWHDAGDCNKYPPWVRFPIFMLLDLYDLRREAFTDKQLNLSESGDGVPDLIDLAQWELDWLLKMQFAGGPQAGAVYDRIHESAAPKAQHARLQEERRLLPPTAEATAVCAASWARGARTLRAFPTRKEAAAKYLAAADLAFQRLAADKAEPRLMLTAAASLYETTGEAKYLPALKDAFGRCYGELKTDHDRSEKFMWAAYDCSVIQLACSERESDGLREPARAWLKATADRALAAARQDAYHVPLWNLDHYCWSSSQNIGKMGYYALMTNRFAPNEAYARMAEDGLHYLLGRNALALSLVSGYGRRFTDVYHTIYGGSATAWQPLPPGIIGGGVNQWESRGISAWPAKHYRSDPNNWTLTEPAIYYNAPLVFLSGYFAMLAPGKP